MFPLPVKRREQGTRVQHDRADGQLVVVLPNRPQVLPRYPRLADRSRGQVQELVVVERNLREELRHPGLRPRVPYHGHDVAQHVAPERKARHTEMWVTALTQVFQVLRYDL